MADDKKKSKKIKITEIPKGGLKKFGSNVGDITLKFVVFLFIASPFSYLTKIINETGLGGTDPTKAPFNSKLGPMGCLAKDGEKTAMKMYSKFKDNVQGSETFKKLSSMADKYVPETKAKIDKIANEKINKFEEKTNLKKKKFNASEYIRNSLKEWSFPYKSDVLCDKSNIYWEPLSYRFYRWIINTTIFSYAYGRQALEFVFELFSMAEDYVAPDTVAFFIGPFVVLFIMRLVGPIYSIGSHIVGEFGNIGNLVPRNLFQWWFPFITMFIAMFLLFIIPIVGGGVQIASLVFFLIIYPFTEKTKFSIGKDEKQYSGPMFIWKNITSRLKYILTFYFAIITSYAFTDLNVMYGSIFAFITLFTYLY